MALPWPRLIVGELEQVHPHGTGLWGGDGEILTGMAFEIKSW